MLVIMHSTRSRVDGTTKEQYVLQTWHSMLEIFKVIILVLYNALNILIFNCVMHLNPPTVIPAIEQKLTMICATSTHSYI